jgi:hypothetical protein
MYFYIIYITLLNLNLLCEPLMYDNVHYYIESLTTLSKWIYYIIYITLLNHSHIIVIIVLNSNVF